MTAIGLAPSRPAKSSDASVSVSAAFELLHRREREPWMFGDRGAEIVRHEWIAATALQAAPRTTLDVGCTVGQLTARLAHALPNVTAVDISPTAVDEARRRVPRTVNFSTGSATTLPFATASFELVVAADGLFSWNLARHHRLAALDELHRVLVPGGRAILTEHTRQSRFSEFIGEVASSNLQIVEVTYMYDRLWYQVESWFRAVQQWETVRSLRRSRRIARAFQRVGRAIGPSASRHVCVVAQRPLISSARD